MVVEMNYLGKQVAPKFEGITSEYLDYDEVMQKFDTMMDYVAKIYIKALNAIHYMHDKYSYEALEMALHDREEDILRTMACGIAGISVVADSLSAIKYAKVKTIRNDDGLVIDYKIEGDFPKYGNDDDRVDQIAVDLVKTFLGKLQKHYTYRNSKHTLSILTITSNVVYGKNTGNTPDRKTRRRTIWSRCKSNTWKRYKWSFSSIKYNCKTSLRICRRPVFLILLQLLLEHLEKMKILELIIL